MVNMSIFIAINNLNKRKNNKKEEKEKLDYSEVVILQYETF